MSKSNQAKSTELGIPEKKYDKSQLWECKITERNMVDSKEGEVKEK